MLCERGKYDPHQKYDHIAGSMAFNPPLILGTNQESGISQSKIHLRAEDCSKIDIGN